jgi:Tfp pilus assembly protein PilN
VLVTGGGSSLYGLLPMIEDQVHLPVLPVSPLARLNTSKLDLTDAQMNLVGPVLSTPIGLALPEPDKSVKKFNLLPPEVAKRARMKRIQERTLVGCVAVLVLLLAFGAWKFLKVHNAQNNVATLQTEITALNAQVPKYDLVVAANNAYSAGVARRASVLDSAIDWPLVFDNLVAITPAGAEVQSFNGASTSSTTSGTSAATTTGTAGTSTSSGTTSAAIGTVQLGVTGPGPNLTISEAWINAVSGSKFFANPLQGATTANPDSTISFPFTVSVTPNASLSQNASLK